jgi:hypothetical protein
MCRRLAPLAPLLAGALFILACKGKSEPGASPEPGSVRESSVPVDGPDVRDPNGFWGNGPLSFVTGTAGSDLQDRRLRAQIDVVRSLVIPEAAVIPDTEIELEKGPDAWPANPVLYGRPDENRLLAALAPRLSLVMDVDHLEIGGERFQGEGIRLVAAVPAQEATRALPGHPPFLVYAGTGEAGIAEINAGLPRSAPIVVADRFGVLRLGDWQRNEDGTLRARMRPESARRIGYRKVTRSLRGIASKGKAAGTADVDFFFPEMLPPAANEEALIDAGVAGLERVVDTLHIANPVPMSIYLYPDQRSKDQLAGAGQGHAVPSARSLHVVSMEPGALEGLVAHEGTHVLAYYAFGPPGSALLGEGLAVWVSGRYGGATLEEWRATLSDLPPLEPWLGPAWTEVEEKIKYPVAGLFAGWLVKKLGLPVVTRELYGATFESWPERSRAAGLDPARVNELFAGDMKATQPQ